MKRRKRPSETTRRMVAANQKWTCAMCRELLSAFFQIDHKRALENGGTNLLSNLQALCANCHATKTASVDMAPDEYESRTGKSKYFAGGPLSLP